MYNVQPTIDASQTAIITFTANIDIGMATIHHCITKQCRLQYSFIAKLTAIIS